MNLREVRREREGWIRGYEAEYQWGLRVIRECRCRQPVDEVKDERGSVYIEAASLVSALPGPVCPCGMADFYYA